jgi:hypothetical protein
MAALVVLNGGLLPQDDAAANARPKKVKSLMFCVTCADGQTHEVTVDATDEMKGLSVEFLSGVSRSEPNKDAADAVESIMALLVRIRLQSVYAVVRTAY